jgi:hypothetical protein
LPTFADRGCRVVSVTDIPQKKQTYLECSLVEYETVCNFVGVGRICSPEHGGSRLFLKVDSYLKAIQYENPENIIKILQC